LRAYFHYQHWASRQSTSCTYIPSSFATCSHSSHSICRSRALLLCLSYLHRAFWYWFLQQGWGGWFAETSYSFQYHLPGDYLLISIVWFSWWADWLQDLTTITLSVPIFPKPKANLEEDRTTCWKPLIFSRSSDLPMLHWLTSFWWLRCWL
jgi:hypothetical protein